MSLPAWNSCGAELWSCGEWELGIAAAPFHRWENRSQNIQAGNAELV